MSTGGVVFWVAVIGLCLVFARVVLAYLRRFLPLVLVALLLVLVLTHCEGETAQLINGFG